MNSNGCTAWVSCCTPNCGKPCACGFTPQSARTGDLLPYLVRRLLENGANSSFVNRFLDREAPVHELVRDPLQSTLAEDGTPHPKIPAPPNL